MLATQTNSLAPGAAGLLAPRRILRWHKVLARLRPLRLGALVRELNQTDRLIRGLQLVERHFPAALPAFNVRGYDWDDVLREFFHLVEDNGWLPIDWDTLDDLYNRGMMVGDDDDDDGLENDSIVYLAGYIDGIPLRTLGWGEEKLLNEDPAHWRVVLSGLLSETEMSADVIVELEMYDVLQDLTLEDIWDHLETADFSGYDEPLCWLPDIARICAGCTGNEILDGGYDFDELDPWRWRWDTDLGRLRELWVAAKPLAEKYEKFDDWMMTMAGNDRAEYHQILQQMALAVLGVEVVNA